MPNKSAQIRDLAQKGLSVAEIARKLNVRYQFAYGVCSKAGLLSRNREREATGIQLPAQKPILCVERLVEGGFHRCGEWKLSAEALTLPTIPKLAGVYAFVVGGAARYVGVATRSLATRLSGYARPGPTQRTNQRVNAALVELLTRDEVVEIWCATPPELEWNGFKVNGAAGLEAGLLMTFHLPWNIKGL